MLKASRGDMKAFEDLVSIFQKPVLNTIYRYLGDASFAEDLAQEVFLRIFQARKRYKPLAKFETWVHRIVYNVVVNEAQYRGRRKAMSLDVCIEGGHDRKEFMAGSVTDPLERLETEELHLKVRESVLSLPPNQRMAVILNKYEDMSYQEVAAALGTSVKATKSMLFRAREKVKSKLERYMKSEVSNGM